MKKIVLLFTLLAVCTSCLQARTVDVTAAYTGSSDFAEAKAGATFALGVNLFAGVEAKYVDDKVNTRPYYGGFKDSIYSVRLPVRMDLDILTIHVTPFYYFSNKSNRNEFQDASAYGINTQFVMNLEQNEVEDLYTEGYLGISYANQKGTLFKSTLDSGMKNQNYQEVVYTLGMRKNFYQAFLFNMSGSVFQYPDGISEVRAFRGVMDQQDLAFTQSFDIIRELPKYTLGARITRTWPDNFSSFYMGYRYGEFYTADAEHSLLVGNTFVIAKAIQVDLAYNHLMTIHDKNKRDILFLSLSMSF